MKYFLDFSSGTIYIEKPSTTELHISGSGTTTIQGQSLPNPLSDLYITDNAKVIIGQSLSVTTISSDGTGEIELTTSAHITANAIGDSVLGSRCDIVVNSGTQLTIADQLCFTPSSADLRVDGTLTANSLVIGSSSGLVVGSSGILKVNSLQLQETVVAELQTGGRLEPRTATRLETVQLGYSAILKYNVEDVTLNTTAFVMKSKSQLLQTTDRKTVAITAYSIQIDDDAIISVAASGELTGSGAGDATKGGSHGGEGGANTGTTYGKTKLPDMHGSGTGSVRGGGVISLHGSSSVVVDGVLNADGENSTIGSAGSGGSVLIRGSVLTGHGTISANGGESGTAGKGAGGGGRIGIHASDMSGFLATYTTYGGQGQNKDDTGASGTVFLFYQQAGGVNLTDLYIDNKGQSASSETVVTEITLISSIQIYGRAVVSFDSSITTTDLKTVNGDHTGVLKINSGQSFTIATDYGVQSAYALECKVVVSTGGTATLPGKLQLTDNEIVDDHPDHPYNLEVYGTIVGTRELIVSYGGNVYISYDSRSGPLPSQISNPGILSLVNLDITDQGVLELGMDSNSEYTVSIISNMNVQYGGIVKGKFLTISAPDLQVAYNAQLHVNGGGSAAGLGTGAGSSGAGASFGGSGGTSSSNDKPAVESFGSLFTADQFGSGGGSSNTDTGGAGGGRLKVTVTNVLTLNGLLASNGEDAAGGGGSGGSVAVVTGHMTGFGSVSVAGGSSNTTGGGGGGGRITLDVTGDYNFTGGYITKGGNSVSAMAGGAGTAYLLYKVNNLDHHVLKSDNTGVSGATVAATYVDITTPLAVTFDELNVGDSTVVELVTPNLHFTAETLTCGTDR